MSVAPQAVVVTRPTEYETLLAHHGTRGQVEFFLRERGQGLDELDRRHAAQADALRQVARAIPDTWRRSSLDRSDLARWIFEPDQIVIAVGQDGLVANVAKYLDGQPVIGINPEPHRNPGVLVRHAPERLAAIIDGLLEGGALGATAAGADADGADAGGRARGRAGLVVVEQRWLVEARTDDGQRLRALNELYVGHATHQSARYEIAVPAGAEQQSSSGILIGTGTGSTGWCRSVWQERRLAWELPETTSGDLAWFVREAWPSPTTSTSLTAGLLTRGESLAVRSERDGLVVFGDGIESDRLELRWGQTAEISLAATALRLV